MTTRGYSPATPFVCAMCGNCCRGEGYVRVSPAEIARMASHLELSEGEFRERYCRTPQIAGHADAGDLWLIDKPGPEQECILLQDNRCAVHPVKPQRCIDFPLKWRTPDVLDYCVGMNR